MATFLAGGRVVDPANGVNDEVGDVWIDGGRVIPGLPTPWQRPAGPSMGGYVVMPGGVDVHSHIAGAKVNSAGAASEERRSLQTVWPRREGFRSGTMGSVPSTFVTGTSTPGSVTRPRPMRRSLRWEPGSACRVSRHAAAGQVDARADGKPPRDPRPSGQRRSPKVRQTVAWLLDYAKGYGIKVVNPGGVEQWKQGGTRCTAWDNRVDRFGVTPPDRNRSGPGG